MLIWYVSQPSTLGYTSPLETRAHEWRYDACNGFTKLSYVQGGLVLSYPSHNHNISMCLNPWHAEFLLRKTQDIYLHFVSLPIYIDIWNLFLWKMGTYLSYIINMTVDDLVTAGARAQACLVLIEFVLIIPVSASQGLWKYGCQMQTTCFAS